MVTRDVPVIEGALQRELESRGLSYEQAGRLAGRTRQIVWRLATGRVTATTWDTATRLVWVLDVPPSTLFVMPNFPLGKSPAPYSRESSGI